MKILFKKFYTMAFYIGIICILSIMFGCISREEYLRTQTTGRVGCPPDEITIEKINTLGGLVSGWTAKCKGKTYYCTSMTSGVVCSKADAE